MMRGHPSIKIHSKLFLNRKLEKETRQQRRPYFRYEGMYSDTFVYAFHFRLFIQSESKLAPSQLISFFLHPSFWMITFDNSTFDHVRFLMDHPK